ncbi:MAG TPA: MarR family transcriptional regulator [Candidatus Sulfotelmatobacter sp.]|nr:MarR family transcriptional regulator [Candidatus Sulfotelmatobacter sp.]
MPRIDKQGKTKRAYAAYESLLDASAVISQKMSRQLRTWNLSLAQYRVLEELFHQGPQYQQELSRKFSCTKQNTAWVIGSLEEWGLIERVAARLPLEPPENPENSNGEPAKRHSREGRKIMKLRLTKEGEKLIAYVFPAHAKVVKAEFRCLAGREQESLARLCHKLKEGDFLKFFKEARMLTEEELEWT